MSIDQVRLQFAEHMETTAKAGEVLPAMIEATGQAIVNSLLNGGKVLTCGIGASGSAAQYFASMLVNRFETERPSLPAIALNADAVSMAAIANDSAFIEVFAKPIRALGNPEDVLIAVSVDGFEPSIIQAVQAAHDREMQVCALTGREGGELVNLYSPQDIELRIPSFSLPRIQELHTLILHCLCDYIDQQLFGGV